MWASTCATTRRAAPSERVGGATNVTIKARSSYLPLMVRLLMLVCAVGAAIALAGSASGGRATWRRPDARDKALLASVLHGMRTDLRTVRLTQLAPEWRKGRTPGGLELVTTTSVSPTATVASTKAGWDSLLIAHAYNERCFRHADHCVRIDGTPKVDGPAGRSGVRKPFWDAHAVAHAIRHAFTAAGLHVTSIAFEHPNAFAPIITVRSSHPRQAWNAFSQKARRALSPVVRHTEGVFIQMFDAHGRLFFVSAGSGSTGQAWCAPALNCLLALT
jgi:hypothetical protein